MPVSGSRRTSIVWSASSMPASGLKKVALSALVSNLMSPMRSSDDAVNVLGVMVSGPNGTRIEVGRAL